MGTNYYWHEENKCSLCGHNAGRKLHIGKASMGWYFSLRVYRSDGPANLSEWQALWASGGKIRDEYECELSITEMMSLITQRSSWRKSPAPYDSWPAFHCANTSEDGINGLARTDTSRDPGCIGHGDGTWSMFIVDFS